MKQQTIEFSNTPSTSESSVDPWRATTKGSYRDLILKPEFATRSFKFPTGATWFRIVPALRASNKGWMLGVHALHYEGGRHSHAKTIKPGGESVFDAAYQWGKTNRPGSLYSKTNKKGFKLLPDPICLFWILVDVDGKIVSRLVLLSGYDGSRGGNDGLGHQIWKKVRERDELGNLVTNPIDAEAGLQICVEKGLQKDSRYPIYSLKIGRMPVPMSELFTKMDPSEINALTALEDTVYLPSEEEEWQLLEKVIDPATVKEIRAAQS